MAAVLVSVCEEPYRLRQCVHLVIIFSVGKRLHFSDQICEPFSLSRQKYLSSRNGDQCTVHAYLFRVQRLEKLNGRLSSFAWVVLPKLFGQRSTTRCQLDEEEVSLEFLQVPDRYFLQFRERPTLPAASDEIEAPVRDLPNLYDRLGSRI